MWPITLSSRWWKIADVEGRLERSEGTLDPPQRLVGQGHLGGRQLGAGGEHELAVQPGLELDGGFVEGDAALGDLEEAGKAAIADHRLGAVVVKRLAELGQQRLTVGGVLLGFDRVTADHISAARRA
jgi:hypothetical protein